MLFNKSKYRPVLKNRRIQTILERLGLNDARSGKSEQIYETFRDYMTLEQCSKKEAMEFTAKYYRLSRKRMTEILRDFSPK